MSKNRFSVNEKRIIGLIHLAPLPGTPFYVKDSFQRILDTAVGSAHALKQGGAHGCLIQTVDRVYTLNESTDITRVLALAKITGAVAESVGKNFQIGVQVMRNANQAALAIAKLHDASFIRAETLVGQTSTPHGIVVADSMALMEYRHKVDAFEIDIVADIYTRHYQWMNSNKPVEQIAKYAQMVGANAVCLESKDNEYTISMLQRIKEVNPNLPIILSGYTNHANAKELLAHAHGAFVGSCFEKDGWGSAIDVKKVAQYMEVINM